MPLQGTGCIVAIDGYEQLSHASRAWIEWRCHRAGAGLLVTSHTPTRLPTLIELKPSRAVVDQLVAKLLERGNSLISPADVAASFDCHGSNVRELLFSLYSLHEMRSRCERTIMAATA
jgi:hypothetical protein